MKKARRPTTHARPGVRIHPDELVTRFKQAVKEKGDIKHHAKTFGIKYLTAYQIATGVIYKDVEPKGAVHKKRPLKATAWPRVHQARELRSQQRLDYRNIAKKTGLSIGTISIICNRNKEAHRPPTIPTPKRLIAAVRKHGREEFCRRLGWDAITLQNEFDRAREELWG